MTELTTYHPRSDSGLGPPVNGDGTLRPLLAPLLPWFTVHYTGVNVIYQPTMDVAKFLVNLQKIALVAGKSYEYNFAVPPTPDPQVWEYAGDFRAAHSAGENDVAYGCLLILGVGQAMTDGQVEAVRWLRDVHLIGRQRLTATATTRPHRAMPGAATACPGDQVLARWPEICAPLAAPLPPPIVPDQPSEVEVPFVAFWKGIPGLCFYSAVGWRWAKDQAEIDLYVFLGLARYGPGGAPLELDPATMKAPEIT